MHVACRHRPPLPPSLLSQVRCMAYGVSWAVDGLALTALGVKCLRGGVGGRGGAAGGTGITDPAGSTSSSQMALVLTATAAATGPLALSLALAAWTDYRARRRFARVGARQQVRQVETALLLGS